LNSEILARLEGVTRATADRDAYSRDLRAFTTNLPKVSDRLVAQFKLQGRK